MYIETRVLPFKIQEILKSKGFHKRDIKIVPSETFNVFDGSADGQRGYSYVINLETWEKKYFQGSWGGSNMFNPQNAVDLCDKEFILPLNGLAIKGSEGYHSWASIWVHPSNMPKYLPEKTETLSKEYLDCLYIYHSIKSSYRKDELNRKRIPDTVVEDCIARGFLKKNKVGISITLLGKNQVSNY